MSGAEAVGIIAEALAKHAPGETFRARSRETGERATVTRCACGSVVPNFAAHQASVIAALPSIAIVALPADPGDSDDMRWSHWTDETEEAFHEALLVELRRIYAVSAATARAAGGES